MRKTLELFTAAMDSVYSVKKLENEEYLIANDYTNLFSLNIWTLQINSSLKTQTVSVIHSLQAEKKEITASVNSANMIT